MQNLQITCKHCLCKGTLDDHQLCKVEGCKLIIMGKRNKPPAILRKGGLQHDPHCVCNRCLDAGATTLEAALLKAEAKQANAKPAAVLVEAKPLKIHVHQHESPVTSSYDDAEDKLFVEVVQAICINIQPRGKRK